MPIFGVTGSFASGKSTVVNLLKAKGAKAYDADKRIHQWYRDKNSSIYKKVVSSFPQALNKKKEISCKKLGRIVFSSRKDLDKLEKIVHPAVIRDLKFWIKGNQKKTGFFVAEVPLLFEKRLQGLFDGIILVSAGRKQIFCRAHKKFGLSPKDISRRLRLFIPDKEKKKKVNFVINNRGTVDELKREVSVVWKKIKEIYL